MEIVVHIPWDNAPDWIDASRRCGPDALIHANDPPPQPESDPETGTPQMLDSIGALLSGGSPNTLGRMDRDY